MNTRRKLAAGVLALVLAGPAVAGCGADSPTLDCGINECTATFPRGLEAGVSALGVNVVFVGVRGDQVTMKVLDQEVILPIDGTASVGGVTLTVTNINATEVVVKISH